MAEEDLPTITESEYRRLLEGGQTASISQEEEDLPTITESQYNQFLDEQAGPLSARAIWKDIKETPSALWGAAKSIPSGISNLAHVPLDLANVGADVTSRIINDIFGTNIPAYEANYGRLERTARGLGTLGAGAAGATVGALAGPVGAITGGAAGVQGFNELLKVLGVDPETTPEEDLANLRRNIIQGGVTYGALKSIPVVTKAVASAPENIQTTTQQKLIGFDPAKGKLKVSAAVDETGAKVPASEALKQVSSDEIAFKNLRDSGYFDEIGTLDSPARASLKLQQFKESAGKDIGKIIDTADSLESQILNQAGLTPLQKAQYLDEASPSFANAKEFLGSLKKVDKAEFNRLNSKFETVKNSWDESSKSLKELKDFQEQYGKINKSSFNDKLSKSERLEADLDNAIYGDLAEALQKRVSNLDINLGTNLKEANKAFSSSKAFQNMAFEGAKKGGPLQVIKEVFNPMSGKGLPLTSGIAALAALNPTIGVPLALLRGGSLIRDLFPAATTKILNPIVKGANIVKKGANVVSQTAAPASLGIPINSALPKAPVPDSSNIFREIFAPATAEAAEMPRAAREAEDVARLTQEEPPMPKLPDAAKQALYEAVIKQESGGKADAVSDVGAIGLMQVMPATAKDIAKELGVKNYDLKDPETNKRFGQYYLDKLLNMFDGDAGLALTAYHSGPGKVQKLLKKTGGKTLEDILEVPFDKGGLGPVGRKYAKQVLARIPTDTALV